MLTTRLFTMNLLVLVLLSTFLSWNPTMALSDHRLCADPDCKSIISLGKGLINYQPGERGMVSFKKNAIIRILSKSAGKDPSVWGVEVNGRAGFAPKKFIQEDRILISDKDLKYLVPIEPPTVPSPNAGILPNASEYSYPDLTATAPVLNQEAGHSVKIVKEQITEKQPDTVPPVKPTPTQIIDGTTIPNMDETVPAAVRSDASTNSLEKENDEDFSIEDVNDDEDVEDFDNYDEEDDVDDDDGEELEKSTKSSDTLTKVPTPETVPVVPPSVQPNLVIPDSKSEEISAEPKEINFIEIQDASNVDSEIPVKEVLPESEKTAKSDESTGKTIGDNKMENVQPVTHTASEKPLLYSEEPSVVLESKSSENLLSDITEKLEEKSEVTPIPLITESGYGNEVIDSNFEEITTLATPVEKQPSIDLEKIPEKLPEPPKVEDVEIKLEKTLSLELDIVANSTETTVDNSEKPELTTEPTINNSEKLQLTTEPTVADLPSTNTNQVPSLLQSFDVPKVVEIPSVKNAEVSLVQPELNPLPQEIQAETPPSKESSEESIPQMEQITESYPAPSAVPLPEVIEKVEPQQPGNVMDSTTSYNEPRSEQPDPMTPQYDIPSPQFESQMPPVYNPPSKPIMDPNDFYGNPERLLEPSVETVKPPLPDSTFHMQGVTEYGSQPSQVVDPRSQVEHTVPVAPPIDSLPLPSQLPPKEEIKAETGKEGGDLFATILGRVHSLLPGGHKYPQQQQQQQPKHEHEHKLHEDKEFRRIRTSERSLQSALPDEEQYCEKLSPNDCTSNGKIGMSEIHKCPQYNFADMTFDNVIEILGTKLLDMSELLVCMAITAASTLVFIFGYYCFCNSSREGALLAKLNMLERSLLAAQKENAILKHDIVQTRTKLSSIEDNSFGSNDMVMALKRELEEELLEKQKLYDQITQLEKELEVAAEAGLELNKIVSELLSNQTGDDSIINSVEELQKQLNQQQNTILEINAVLAEKSRENSELKVLLAEQADSLNGKIASLQQDNDELELEKDNLKTQVEELKSEFEDDMKVALEGKNLEIKRLQAEIVALNGRIEEEHNKRQTSTAKVEALEECLKAVKRDPSVNITQVIDVAHIRAEMLDLQKRLAATKGRLDQEMDSRKVLETQLKSALSEVEKIKHDFHQSEKDKLEAQTRLEVLSNYFKDKESQLQKELSVKESMWLKQQGETVSTVDRMTALQEEINSLKSQNDALRAEIEAQLAAHKAQTGTLENRAHETWLAARQSERRCEEARAEATALRRQLTALAGGNLTDAIRPPNAGGDGKAPDPNNAPSPIHMESPGSPMLGRLPPPPFLPPPFMGPFMGIPPPFVPPGEMRPPPLGRIMSPPPLPGGGSSGSGVVGGGDRRRGGGRYTADQGGYGDYDDNDDEDLLHRRRRNGNWQRDYSPPRTYRSQSPTDSRYNYTDRELMSTYDTETDFSPPPSPRDRRSRGSRSGSYRAYSPPLSASSPLEDNGNGNGSGNGVGSGNKKQPSTKGSLSSGSESSHQKQKQNKGKIKSKSTNKGRSMV